MLLRNPKVHQPPVMVVPNVAAEGRVTLLAAREKLGKSTFAAWLAARLSRGQEIFGVRTKAGRVLWVGLEENIGDAARRFKHMNADVSILLIDRLAGDGGFEQLKAEIIAAKPRFVIIDSLSAYARDIEDESNSTACTRLLKPLVDFIHTQPIALLILHHSTKNGGGYRGSTAIGAEAPCGPIGTVVTSA